MLQRSLWVRGALERWQDRWSGANVGQASDHDLSAASALIGEQPGALRSFGLTLSRAAELANISRATAYRRWETAEALSDDWALFCIELDGWPQRLLRADPAADLAATVADVIGDAPWELGPFARAAVCARPDHAPARAAIVDWERATLEALAAWLDQAVVARGRRWRHPNQPVVVALAGYCLLEGSYIVARGDRAKGWVGDSASGRLVGPIFGWMIDEVSDLTALDPGEPGDPVDVPQLSSGLNDAQRQILADLTLGIAGIDPTAMGGLEPARAVDMGRLARRLGVAEGTLYARWPNTEEFNAALAVHLITQRGDRLEALMHRMIDDFVTGRNTSMRDLAIEGLQAAVVEGAGPAPYDLWAMTPTFMSPAVQDATRRTLEGQRTPMRAISLAISALGDRTPRAGVAIDDVVEILMSFLVGAWRLLALDPALGEREIEVPIGRRPLFGVAGSVLTESYLDPADAPG